LGDRTGITWQNQEKIPRFPLPSIKDTCARYREHLQPLIPTQEWEEINSKITAFEEAPISSDLQKQLEDIDSCNINWVENFWDDMYLKYREPLPINVNPFIMMNRPGYAYDPDFSTASKLVYSFLKFHQLIRNRILQPEYEGTYPLCMVQYTKIVGANRVPKLRRDSISSNRYARNIIVMRNGHLFLFPLENENESFLEIPEIQKRLQQIVAMADQKGEDKYSIGYLTCAPRDDWAQAYSKLQALSARNTRNLDTIAAAALVLNLDSHSVQSLNEASSSLLHNNGFNRWFDKTQLIVSANGIAGWNWEHTAFDGHSILRMHSDMVNDLSQIKPIRFKNPAHPWDELNIPAPSLLEWDRDDQINSTIEQAKQRIQSHSANTQSIVLELKSFGNISLSRLGFNPDSFVQMGMQLAFYRFFGKVGSTYESAMIKRFLHGRTETIRSVSNQSKEYVEKFSSEKPQLSLELLDDACKEHMRTKHDAKNGRGSDRHLFALHSLLQKEKELNPDFKIPKMFVHPSWNTYWSDLLSTSNLSSDLLDLCGFGPCNSEGLGIGYIIRNNEVVFNVTGYADKVATEKFVQTLAEALEQQYNVSTAARYLKK